MNLHGENGVKENGRKWFCALVVLGCASQANDVGGEPGTGAGVERNVQGSNRISLPAVEGQGAPDQCRSQCELASGSCEVQPFESYASCETAIGWSGLGRPSTAINGHMSSLRLRCVVGSDLQVFFEQQLDRVANHMAAFTGEDQTNRGAFLEHWKKIMSDGAILKRTILFEEAIAGHILRFEQFTKPSISYWLGKDYWGRGVATRALLAFLPLVPERPLTARAAADNLASLRVLKKCGFVITGSDTDFAAGRGQMVEETILTLKA